MSAVAWFLPDMIIITCAFSKGNKLCTAVFFSGVKTKQTEKKPQYVNFWHAPLFPFF